MHSAVFLLLLAAGAPAFGGPLPNVPSISVQENFDLDRFMGKWYDVVIASTCPWLQKYKNQASVGTMEIKSGDTSKTLNLTRTAIRHGTCKQISMAYELTETPGKFFYQSAKWGADIDSYVVHTNYDEYAIVVMTKKKQGSDMTITAKLYGRSMDLRTTLTDDFIQLVKDLGMSDDNVVTLKKTKECVPGDPAPDPEIQRVRRNVVLPAPEEGSGYDAPMFINADACLSPPDTGPCFAMYQNYFYNSSIMTCQMFTYGGCLGNQNNFKTEKACLQTCRTEAACRLPLDPGTCNTHDDVWGFDSGSGKCVSFKYSGCQGNGNKFYSQRECEEYCGVMKFGDEELIKVS